MSNSENTIRPTVNATPGEDPKARLKSYVQLQQKMAAQADSDIAERVAEIDRLRGELGNLHTIRAAARACIETATADDEKNIAARAGSPPPGFLAKDGSTPPPGGVWEADGGLKHTQAAEAHVERLERARKTPALGTVVGGKKPGLQVVEDQKTPSGKGSPDDSVV